MEINKSLLNQVKINAFQSDAIITNDVIIETITIYKNTSRPRAKKSCLYYLHVQEPTGIEILKSTTVKISVKEKNLNGTIGLYIHNTDDLKRITNIDVTLGKTTTIKELGEIFFNINGVKSLNAQLDEKFSFTIQLEFPDSSSYLVNPIFDIRDNKISSHNILNPETFKQKVLEDGNKEHGMVMISNNSRMYMPKSKYIPKNFNPLEILNLYEDVIESYNKVVGFNKNDESFLLRPREQFILVSARNKPNSGSTMIDTLPQTCYLYFNDYWDIFFQFAFLFEQSWSLLEIWTNLYTIYMGNRTEGIDWLWESNREDFENKNIEYLYNDYLVKDKQGLINLDAKQEIYMLLTIMENLGANFVTKLEKYSRENKAYLVGMEYIVYYIAKLFGINTLIHAEFFGQKISDKAIINSIIDMSNNTLFNPPLNMNFDKYRDLPIPVTVKSIYIDDPVIIGMCNPEATIRVKIRGKEDVITASYSGKFVYKIYDPVIVGDEVTIISKAPNNRNTISRKFNIVTRLDNNSINFISTMGYLIAKVMFDTVKKELRVVSTGRIFNALGEDKVYFTLTLKNKQGTIKTQATIKENIDATVFKQTLDGVSFEYMDNITLSYKHEGFAFISKYDGKVIYTPKGEVEKFNITTCGLIEYFE